MTGAGEALRGAAVAALEGVDGIGAVHDAVPVTRAAPHAVVDIDGESDWGHKSGAGREVRLAVTLSRGGEERPVALRRAAVDAEAALGALGGEIGAWRIVTMRHVRTREVRRPKAGTAVVIEYRARLLAL